MHGPNHVWFLKLERHFNALSVLFLTTQFLSILNENSLCYCGRNIVVLEVNGLRRAEVTWGIILARKWLALSDRLCSNLLDFWKGLPDPGELCICSIVGFMQLVIIHNLTISLDALDLRGFKWKGDVQSLFKSPAIYHITRETVAHADKLHVKEVLQTLKSLMVDGCRHPWERVGAASLFSASDRSLMHSTVGTCTFVSSSPSPRYSRALDRAIGQKLAIITKELWRSTCLIEQGSFSPQFPRVKLGAGRRVVRRWEDDP